MRSREILTVAEEAGLLGPVTSTAVRSCAAALVAYRRNPGDLRDLPYALEGMAAARTVISPGYPGWIPAQQKLGMEIATVLENHNTGGTRATTENS